MRITCVIHSLNGGGAERVMASLVGRLSDRGHEVTLITLDDGLNDRYEVSAAVHRIGLGVMGDSDNLPAAVLATLGRVSALRRALKRSKPNVVLSFCDQTNALTLLASRFWSVPVVVSERSDPASQPMGTPWRQLRPYLYRHAQAVIVLTAAAATTVAPWCAASPIVIPSAIEPPPTATVTPGDHHRTLIAVGRLEHEKGFDQLIAAFSMIANRVPELRLVIHGEGTLRNALQNQRDSLGLKHRIDFPGWTRPIWPVLEPGSVFILPSRYEGFPSALLEAMASGMACVAFDCPSGPAAVIRNQVDGLLIAAGDIKALAESIERLLLDNPLRLRLGEVARQVTTRFSWNAMIDRYERVLIESLRSSNR